MPSSCTSRGPPASSCPDGSIVRLNYDGKNGHPYTSIGRYLIDPGLLAADKVSLQALKKWLRADPERGRRRHVAERVLHLFPRARRRSRPARPARRAEHAADAGRSLAVDTAFHALGSPVWVSAPTLTHASQGSGFNRLMIAQDVGSAIKGPERGDIYFGSGDEGGPACRHDQAPGQLLRAPSCRRPQRGASARALARTLTMAKDREGRTIAKSSGKGAGRDGPSDDDFALWEHTARTLKPLKGKKQRVHARRARRAAACCAAPRAPSREAAAAPRSAPLRRSRRQRRLPARRRPPSPSTAQGAPDRLGQDRDRGAIDLHGMRQSEAHAALRRFLLRAHADERRWVLVITGKGDPLRRDARRGR